MLLPLHHVLILNVEFDGLEFVTCEGEVITFPLPLEFSFAAILCTIKHAPRADPVIDDGYRLKAVGEDNVRVHGSHIKVVDEWSLLEGRRTFKQLGESVPDLPKKEEINIFFLWGT